jgi:type III restriction enzyme
MQLKAYQSETLEAVRHYLAELDAMRTKDRSAREIDADLGFDWAAKAWERTNPGRSYRPRRNGLGHPMASICLKIPTGGGKTLLAAKTIDLANTHYRKSNRGLVLWVVPTTQIYQQTLAALKDRDHPYRQTLDAASAGRTQVFERTQRFGPGDIEGSLCVLLLMLPAAARQTNETLRMFKDSGGFDAFFPRDDDFAGHVALLARFPNLDTFDDGGGGFFRRQIKTSLGNTLRLLAPMVILDEGQKAYSELARRTIEGFNPCLLVELSATPPSEANVLVDIRGQALEREGMIKLDLHIENRGGVNWKDTLLAAVERRRMLEEQARKHEAETGSYIRPICLVQVERTGRDQRASGFIHSEDVREYLLACPGMEPGMVAVKTSERDELKEVDEAGGLLRRDCPIRFIITKQALQEGWDCSFAYVLAVLTNPGSKTALTQLVGRILRQPYARKTGNRRLDESYVFCFQRKGTDLMKEIRAGFSAEGLGDLQSRIVTGTGGPEDLGAELSLQPRAKFAKAAERLILPAFMIREGRDWRPVHYEPDILSRVPWKDVDVSPLFNLALLEQKDKNVSYRKGLGEGVLTEDIEETAEPIAWESDEDPDYAFAASHLLDVMPNPWRGNELARRVFEKLLERFDRRVVEQNFVLVLDEMHRHLARERDRLARAVFQRLLDDGTMRFMVVAKSLEPNGFNRPPAKAAIREKEPRAVRSTNLQYELSLFAEMPETDFNPFEQSVATFLDDQQPLYFWYRNRSRADYFVQGWRQNRIYADFIFTTRDDSADTFGNVFVVETKGRHLSGVTDARGDLTDVGYKRDVFTLCSDMATKKNWSEFAPSMQDKRMRFEVVDEEGWTARLTELLSE